MGNAKVPDGWPSNVPVYNGSITAGMASPNGKTVVVTTSDSPSAVHDFYKSKLSSMKLQSDLDVGTAKVLVFRDGKTTISVNIASTGSKTNVTVSVAGG
jgi:hypothetical protein